MGEFLTGPVLGEGPGAAWPGLDEVVARVRSSAPRLGPVRLMAIDGPAGSGKTTLAAAVARRLVAAGDAVATVHLDDLYEGWTGLEGVWDRLERDVLGPLSRGEAGRYQRYDWASGDRVQWRIVPVPDVLVVEGCGAAARAVDGRAAVRIWVEAPETVRLERGLARDGQAMRDQWLAWMADESAHFTRERTRERADVRFAT